MFGVSKKKKKETTKYGMENTKRRGRSFETIIEDDLRTLRKKNKIRKRISEMKMAHKQISNETRMKICFQNYQRQRGQKKNPSIFHKQ